MKEGNACRTSQNPLLVAPNWLVWWVMMENTAPDPAPTPLNYTMLDLPTLYSGPLFLEAPLAYPGLQRHISKHSPIITLSLALLQFSPSIPLAIRRLNP